MALSPPIARRPADNASELNNDQANDCDSFSRLDCLPNDRPNDIQLGGVQPTIGRSLRRPASCRNGLQRLPSDQRHLAKSKSEPRRAEFCRHQPNAVDKRTRHQSFSSYPTPHHAELHSKSRRNRLCHRLYSKSRSEVGHAGRWFDIYGPLNLG